VLQLRRLFNPETEMTHAHDFLHALLSHARPVPAADIHAFAAERFGEAARFCTCSHQDLSLDELLPIMQAKGKLVLTGPGTKRPGPFSLRYFNDPGPPLLGKALRRRWRRPSRV
jgi:probable metal-binding protein